MKVVVLAGGYGTRISEESRFKPKPMVELGGMPILWHIMKAYSHHGFNEFIVCAGYKQHVIKEYFADYFLHTSDVTFDFRGGKQNVVIHKNAAEPWKVTIVDTGLDTMTGGRVKRVASYVGEETFLLTYGDGVADVDIAAEVAFHKAHGKMLTITTVNPGQRFGTIDMAADGTISSFREKSAGDGTLINGGYMVCEPSLFDLIEGDGTVLERDPFEKAAAAGQLMGYRHQGFWQCMDNVREKQYLEKLWAEGNAPWKVW